MRTITSTSTIYQAADGTEFLTRDLCVAHEKLCQLRVVIKDKWPSFFRNDVDTVATMLIATWDQLCNAMEVLDEEWTSAQPNDYFLEEETLCDDDADDIHKKAEDHALAFAKQYTVEGVGFRSFSANYRDAYARKLAELEKQSVTPLAPAEKINWFNEYPELSVRTISVTMCDAARRSAIEFNIDSNEYRAMFNIEMARMLDEKVADAQLNELLMSRFDGHSATGHLIDKSLK